MRCASAIVSTALIMGAGCVRWSNNATEEWLKHENAWYQHCLVEYGGVRCDHISFVCDASYNAGERMRICEDGTVAELIDGHVIERRITQEIAQEILQYFLKHSKTKEGRYRVRYSKGDTYVYGVVDGEYIEMRCFYKEDFMTQIICLSRGTTIHE